MWRSVCDEFRGGGDWTMGMQQMMALVAAALALSTLPGFAGPCSQAIDQMQAKINARLKATADAGGRAAPESSAATMHRQPTPGSIAAAEGKLGELSPQTVETIAAAMTRARAADRAGDQSGCEQALADAQRTLGP
jgi:hypothetical protein